MQTIIGVIGGGTVGRATARAYMEWGDVRVYDLDPARGTHSLRDTLMADLVFVCLPSPQESASLAADLTAIESFFAEVAGSMHNFVLRSTVPIGTTRRLRDEYRLGSLCHSPEFLTARCSLVDAQLPSRNIVGGMDTKAGLELSKLYLKRFPGAPLFLCSPDESEAVKLFTNAFFAVKISYFNEIRALADDFELRWDKVLPAVLADGRISHAHTMVPGKDGKRGWGGACFGKDLGNLITTIEEAGLLSHVTRAAYDRNEEDRQRH